MQIDAYLLPYVKLKTKWIKDLNIKQDTVYLIEEKVGEMLELIGTEDNFLNTEDNFLNIRELARN